MVNITPAPSKVPEAVVAKVAQLRDQLRKQHGVQLVKGDAEGDTLKYAAGGVYGFTYAPQTLDCGLFAKFCYMSFEMHKLSDNSIKLLVAVTADTKKKLETATELFPVELFPDAYGSAHEFVAIPYENLRKLKQPSREDDGNRITGFYQPA